MKSTLPSSYSAPCCPYLGVEGKHAGATVRIRLHLGVSVLVANRVLHTGAGVERFCGIERELKEGTRDLELLVYHLQSKKKQ